MSKKSSGIVESPEKIVRKLRDSKPMGLSFDGMIPIEVETPEHILAGLINPDNLGMKSRISAPLVLTQFEMMGVWAGIDGYPKTKNVFEQFAEFFRTNGISQDGERVKEIVQALSERIKQQERSASEKLTAPPE